MYIYRTYGIGPFQPCGISMPGGDERKLQTPRLESCIPGRNMLQERPRTRPVRHVMRMFMFFGQQGYQPI